MAATFCITLFLLLMQFLWKYIDDLVGKGLEFTVIAELLIYTTAGLVPMALPLAILLASIMTFGNMGEYSELTALKSAGIPLHKIMMPLIILIIIISGSAFFFSNNVLPHANLKMRSLLYDIQQKRPELQIREGVFYNDIDGYSIKISERNYHTNMLYDVMIYDHTSEDGNKHVTVADSGLMRMTEDKSHLVTTLYNGHNYIEMEDMQSLGPDPTFPHRRDEFDEQVIIMDLSGFALERTDEDLFRQNYQMMNLSQLEYYRDSLYNHISRLADSYVTRMLRTNIIRHEPGYSGSTDPEKLGKREPFDIVAVEDTIPEYQKAGAYEHALTQARSARSQISSSRTSIDWNIRYMRRHEMEWQRKFTLSFACFIFFFIGAPLGAIIRKGGLGMPVVVSVLFFIFYYVIDVSAEKFIRENVILAFPGMWISSIILLPIGIFLTYKAVNDSSIMNIDTYINGVKKLFNMAVNNNKKEPELVGSSDENPFEDPSGENPSETLSGKNTSGTSYGENPPENSSGENPEARSGEDPPEDPSGENPPDNQ